MKKILSLLAAVGLLSTAGLSTVACGETNTVVVKEKELNNQISGAPYDAQGNLILLPTEWGRLADISGPDIKNWTPNGGNGKDYPSPLPSDAEITYGWWSYDSSNYRPEMYGNVAIGYIAKTVRTNGYYYNFKSEFKRNINKDIYNKIKVSANW